MARGSERRSGAERRVTDIGPAVLGERDRRSGRERRSGTDRVDVEAGGSWPVIA